MSLHDGPGIRTTVFFKGCNLHCIWCHNPESIGRERQVNWNVSHCIGCGECISACAGGARSIQDNCLLFDRSKCTGCGMCAKVCPSEASAQIGDDMEISEIAAEAEKDREMYRLSSGGVTCSGGEPLLQADAVAELLKRLKKAGIHTAVDTAGNVPFQFFEKVMPHTDLFLYDLKHWDPEIHRRCTGAGNELILENFERLAEEKEVIVRIPFVQGIQEGAISPIAKFLAGRKHVRLVEILPYHRLGEKKYSTLSRAAPSLKPPSEEAQKRAEECFEKEGIPVKTAGMA